MNLKTCAKHIKHVKIVFRSCKLIFRSGSEHGKWQFL